MTSRLLISTFVLIALFLINFTAQAQFLGASISSVAQLKKGTKLNICFISLNNDKEFHVLKDFVTKIQSKTGLDIIEVSEHIDKGDDPQKVIDELSKQNIKCHGLVISGHHTGSFAGIRSEKTLSIDFMERVSCENKQQQFFTNVNSLWLQGCRTLGAPDEVFAANQTNTNLVDFHSNRVFAERQADNLPQGAFEIEQEFASLLDQDTPYTTRFSKTFPNARIYGWSGTAPGVFSKSEYNLPSQIHNVARMLRIQRKQTKKFGNPLQKKFSLSQAKSYQDAMVMLLMPLDSDDELAHSISSWIQQVKANKTENVAGMEVAFNYQSNVLQPLISMADAELSNSRMLECSLRTTKNPMEFNMKLNGILTDKRMIGLTFYTLKDIATDTKAGRKSEYAVDLMKASEPFKEFLRKKMTSEKSGLVKRIQYFGLYRKLDMGMAILSAQELRTLFFKKYAEPIRGPDRQGVIDFKKQIRREALENKLVYGEELLQYDSKFGKEIVDLRPTQVSF
jgi:hypothetical protein